MRWQLICKYLRLTTNPWNVTFRGGANFQAVSRYIAVVVWTTMVNTQTDIDTYTHRQTVHRLLAQLS